MVIHFFLILCNLLMSGGKTWIAENCQCENNGRNAECKCGNMRVTPCNMRNDKMRNASVLDRERVILQNGWV